MFVVCVSSIVNYDITSLLHSFYAHVKPFIGEFVGALVCYIY